MCSLYIEAAALLQRMWHLDAHAQDCCGCCVDKVFLCLTVPADLTWRQQQQQRGQRRPPGHVQACQQLLSKRWQEAARNKATPRATPLAEVVLSRLAQWNNQWAAAVAGIQAALP